jgi:hypothetical protein
VQSALSPGRTGRHLVRSSSPQNFLEGFTKGEESRRPDQAWLAIFIRLPPAIVIVVMVLGWGTGAPYRLACCRLNRFGGVKDQL